MAASTPYIPPSRRGQCSDCGDVVALSRTSSMTPRCRACQRVARGLAPDQKVNDNLYVLRKHYGKPCHRCGEAVPAGSRRWKFCSEECFRKARYARGSGSKTTTEGRGYGREHQEARRRLLPAAYGTACHFCGQTMLLGQRLHLDHTEDRQGYRGFAHAACNVVDGAHRGGQRFRERVLRGAS